MQSNLKTWFGCGYRNLPKLGPSPKVQKACHKLRDDGTEVMISGVEHGLRHLMLHSEALHGDRSEGSCRLDDQELYVHLLSKFPLGWKRWWVEPED